MSKCYNCKHLKDQFGNYVMCDLLSRFVDWWYWNDQTPDDCPLKELPKEDDDDKPEGR